MASTAEVRQLIAIIDRAYNLRSWHGTNLRGSLRGVTALQAAWRPARGRHNIDEIVVHCAYWKYAVWRRLSGEPRGSFPLAGSNWFPRSARPSDAAWQADVALLDRMHRTLREFIDAMTAAHLRRADAAGKGSRFELVAGIAAHDLYHAGQIQLLKRLQRRN